MKRQSLLSLLVYNILMGCCSSKKPLVVPSVPQQPTSPKTISNGAKVKPHAFPWLLKALTTPELNIEESQLYLRRKAMQKTHQGSSIDTSESVFNI